MKKLDLNTILPSKDDDSIFGQGPDTHRVNRASIQPITTTGSINLHDFDQDSILELDLL